jgi:uncharacterized protein YbjQ (UPF0145 family)
MAVFKILRTNNCYRAVYEDDLEELKNIIDDGWVLVGEHSSIFLHQFEPQKAAAAWVKKNKVSIDWSNYHEIEIEESSITTPQDQEAIEQEKTISKLAALVYTSTTHIIGGMDVYEHGGVMTTTIVAGTNILRDFAAGVRDVIGGNSQAYMDKIKDIQKDAIDALKRDAALGGYNAIIGLTVNTEEITAKTGSMFMITVTGTAVNVR